MRRGAAFRSIGCICVVLTTLILFGLRFGLGVPWIWAYLAAINFTVFLAYVYDKLAARAGYLRIPEKLLHLLALIGGSPAALLGQVVLRHKTIKRSFRKWFLSILILQLVLLAAWLYYARPWL